MARGRIEAGGVVVSFLAPFLVYLRTLSPTVGLVDSGELTAAAALLGNAHPPGFPLYLLATRIVMLFPFGSLAWRANLASALFAAGAAAMMAVVVLQIFRDDARLSPISATFIATFAGLTLGFSRTLWAYATIAEVYTLNTLLLLAVFALMLRWRRVGGDGHLYLAALIFGLAIGVHLVTIGLSIFAIAVLAGRATWSKKAVIAGAIATGAAIAIYMYLPLASMRHPAMDWGAPSTLSRFIDHVTAKQYRSYITAMRSSEQVALALSILKSDLNLLALLLALVGLVSVIRRDRTLAAFIALLFAADLAWIVVYPIANDRDAYLLPAIIAIVIAAAMGAVAIAGHRRSIAAALLALPVIACVSAFDVRDRSRFHVADDYVTNALSAMRPNALCLTNSYSLWSPATYKLDVEKKRPDVTVIELPLLLRTWYLDDLARQHPRLMQPVAAELADFRKIADRWEHTPDSVWAADARSRQDFYVKLDALLVALARRTIERGDPVYMTHELLTAPEEELRPVVLELTTDYTTVPQGVVFELARKNSRPPLVPMTLATRGVSDGTVPRDGNDTIANDLVPAYRNAYLLRAHYLLNVSHYPDALPLYNAAAAIDPSSAAGIAYEREQLVRFLGSLSSPPAPAVAAKQP